MNLSGHVFEVEIIDELSKVKTISYSRNGTHQLTNLLQTSKHTNLPIERVSVKCQDNAHLITALNLRHILSRLDLRAGNSQLCENGLK